MKIGNYFEDYEFACKCHRHNVVDGKNVLDHVIDKRFETLEQTLARRTLSGASVVDLQEQYKKLTQEMITKIKEVK